MYFSFELRSIILFNIIHSVNWASHKNVLWEKCIYIYIFWRPWWYLLDALQETFIFGLAMDQLRSYLSGLNYSFLGFLCFLCFQQSRLGASFDQCRKAIDCKWNEEYQNERRLMNNDCSLVRCSESSLRRVWKLLQCYIIRLTVKTTLMKVPLFFSPLPGRCPMKQRRTNFPFPPPHK